LVCRCRRERHSVLVEGGESGGSCDTHLLPLDDLFTRAFGGNGHYWLAALDFVETDSEYVVLLDLPNVDEKTIAIEFDDGLLTISGKRTKPEGWQFVRAERPYGEFVRSLTLAKGVDSDAIRADYHDGTLEIHVPKPAEYKPKKIALTTFAGT
jgi:HSP20 family protein